MVGWWVSDGSDGIYNFILSYFVFICIILVQLIWSLNTILIKIKDQYGKHNNCHLSPGHAVFFSVYFFSIKWL